MVTALVNMSAYAVRRIAVFYDGSFFQKFNMWCKKNYNHFIDFQVLHEYLAWWISKEVESERLSQFRVVEAHYFQGRFGLEAAIVQGRNNKKKFPSKSAPLPPEAYYIAKDRMIDEILMKANITMHYYPVWYDQGQKQAKEKGIDVWLSLEAYDLAVHKRFDYFVLFSGDEDFVPLVRKINSLGITTIIVSVNISKDSESVNSESIKIRTSQKLIREASYYLYLDERKVLEKIIYKPDER